jgi:hypothetical protein
MVDLHQKLVEQPRFHIGMRYGEAPPITSGPLATVGFEIRPMRRGIERGAMKGAWGSRNSSGAPGTYMGDELFDYHVTGQAAPYKLVGEPRWRPPGSDGLVLFHVLQRPDFDTPTVAVGLCIPRGGPDQIPALVNDPSGFPTTAMTS